jgi:hypothetical protein
MANPIHVNPANAFRRLTIGGSDWCWVVFTIMILSALGALAWAKSVGLFPLAFGSESFSPGHRLPKATSRKENVSLYRFGRPHGGFVDVLRYGIQLGRDDRQNGVQAQTRDNA